MDKLNSHWRWFAVDVTKTSKPLTRELSAVEVRTIKRELKAYLWTATGVQQHAGRFDDIILQDTECTHLHLLTLKSKKIDLEALVNDGSVKRGALRLGVNEVRVAKLSDMPAHNAQNFAGNEVVVMQQECNGPRQWWVIARVPKDSPLERAFERDNDDPDYGKWSTDAVVLFSGPTALLKLGKDIGNGDFPVKFTGTGGVPHDFLVYTTTYERMRDQLDTIPESIFSVTMDETPVMPKLEKKRGTLKRSFFFDSQGKIYEGDLKRHGGKYYARIVTKGWWYEFVAGAFIWALFTAVDWYNNVLFVSQTYRSTYLSMSFLVGMVAFFLLEGYYCWLLAHTDMDYPIHRDDMALGNVGCFGSLHPFQMLLYYLRVPVSVRDMTIWTCPRGGALGRGVAKANKARIHIMTWPTKYHYHCDSSQGRHKIFPMLLAKSFMLLMIQVLTFWENRSFVPFLLLFMPKLCLMGMIVRTLTNAQYEREDLRGWLLSQWEHQRPQDEKIELPQELPQDPDRRLKTLYGVYQKHFPDAVDGKLWEYNKWHRNVLFPCNKGHPDAPFKAFLSAVAITFISTVVAWLLDRL